MVHFICMSLLGAQTENYKMINSCQQCNLNPGPSVYEARSLSVALLDQISINHLNIDRVLPKCAGSSGGRVVKLLACGARGPGFVSPPRHLNFQRLVISCFQVEIWLKDR